MKTYKTIAGHTIEFDPTPDVDAFLEKLQAMLANPKTTEDDMVAVVYGADNPIMNKTMFPGRGAVTADVLKNPVYTVMTDLIFRKHVAQYKVDVDELAAQHTLTVSQVAERLGVHRVSVNKAIDAGRLGSWIKNGQHFIDPRALTTFELSPRGPAPKEARASTEPLDICEGRDGDHVLKVKYPGDRLPRVEYKAGRNLFAGEVSPWRRVAVFSAVTGDDKGKARLFILEPAGEAGDITAGDLHVRGQFKVVEKVNNARKAAEAFEAFEAS